MNLKTFYEEVISYAKECGMTEKKSNSKGNTVVRDNATHYTNNQQLIDNKAYFGFIREEEELSGPYHDFSLVILPQIDDQLQISSCVIAFGVGSAGFVNDNDIASLPWTRRLFTRLRKVGAKSYYKNDFSDLDTPSADLIDEIKNNYPNLKKVIAEYKNVLPASQIIEFDDLHFEERFEIIKQWIAIYATIRGWAGNNSQRNAINNSLPDNPTKGFSTLEIYQTLQNGKYVVLQGAPGTGKTWNALEIAKTYFKEQNVLFEQFHAETTYSDFVYGITPVLNEESLAFKSKEGILYKAIDMAEKTTDNVLLIIDEINRANLSNVLGPVFYLFEKNQSNRIFKFNIGDKEISKMPNNLFVIATMNTADRSLAVVDFALRRRFTWLSLKPHRLGMDNFQKKYFDEFDALFQKYASDEELNLQPGQSYFIAGTEDEMKNRLKYELMPLMKEYFNEGYLPRAKDEFSNYFYNILGILMYE